MLSSCPRRIAGTDMLQFRPSESSSFCSMYRPRKLNVFHTFSCTTVLVVTPLHHQKIFDRQTLEVFHDFLHVLSVKPLSAVQSSVASRASCTVISIMWRVLAFIKGSTEP